MNAVVVVVSAFVSAGIALVLAVSLKTLHSSLFDESKHVLFVCFKPACRHASDAGAFSLLQCLLLTRNYFAPAIVLSRQAT